MMENYGGEDVQGPLSPLYRARFCGFDLMSQDPYVGPYPNVKAEEISSWQ